MAVVAALLLAACAPGALDPGTSAAGTSGADATTPPSPTAWQARPSASATPTASADPEPVLLATLAASDGLAVVDPDAAEPLLATIEVGQAPWGAMLDPETGVERVVALERAHETVAIWQPEDGAPWQAVLAGGFTRDGWWNGLTAHRS